VVDTCEHVVTAVGPLAAAILQSTPDVVVLATSRRALAVKGEIAWPVPPLALPPPEASTAADILPYPAAALFLERALAVRPDLVIDDVAAADIAAICVALDGLPLAIELAASRADVLSPAAIRSRLSDRFELLVDGGTTDARQQTLRAAIDWSFDLLPVDQRTFFARLAAFAGTFDLDAALEVAGAGLAAPLELLSSLVRQSMVARAGDDRYRLLDTLRSYAADVLGDLDADDTRRRHAGYYVVLADRGEAQIRGLDQVRWLERFRHDVNNFRSAIEWSLTTGELEQAARIAGALAWFWTLNGMLAEAIAHLELLIDAEGVPAGDRARCLWGYALLAASLGRLEVAREAGYRAAQLAEEIGDPLATAYGLNAAAVAEWALGNHDRSLDAHAAALRLLDKVGDPWGQAICTVLRARTLFDLGDPEAAGLAREGVEHARRAGDVHVLGIALTQIAHMAVADGDHATAVSAASEALEHQERIGYTEGAVAALHVLGGALRLGGALDEAKDAHRQALALAARIGHAAAMCEAMEELARLAASSDPDLARELLAAARRERSIRDLPSRPRDAEILDALEADLGASDGPHRSFSALVSQLTT
jgi:predicted ATPase